MKKKQKSLTPLGETEMEVLHHVWALGEATVADVRARILRERDVAYTTVMTVLRNLAEKGYLRCNSEGVTYVYSAARPPEEVRHSLLKSLMSKVFDGSPGELVQTLIRNERLSESERAELRQLINQMEDDDANAV